MPSPAVEALSVLVIEDDNHLLRTLRDILRLRGYAPMTAASGGEGLTLAAAAPHTSVAVALIDLNLPDMDGTEVIGRLHAISALTETVILTGHASVDSAVRALRQHTSDYLVKPVAPDQLLTTVERATERWQRRRAEEALRRSEERSQLLLENISDVVVVVDEALSISYVSPSVTRVLGVAPEELIGQRWGTPRASGRCRRCSNSSRARFARAARPSSRRNCACVIARANGACSTSPPRS